MRETGNRTNLWLRALLVVSAAAVGWLLLLPATPGAQAAPERWVPQVGETFYIQCTGKTDLNREAQVYNLDWETTSAAQVKQLHNRGVCVICYFRAGSSEDWRSDDSKFPASVKGNPLDGWDGEYWLDIRKLDTLTPIMKARMDVCRQKGFDAVDPDNTDAWSQDTGFPITKSHQVAYQRAMAAAAHERGLAIGLKNNVEQISQMCSFVDFAVNEECNEWDECDAYAGFLASGKPVYNIEYTGTCPTGLPEGMSSFVGKLSLGLGGKICGQPVDRVTPSPQPPPRRPRPAPAPPRGRPRRAPCARRPPLRRRRPADPSHGGATTDDPGTAEASSPGSVSGTTRAGRSPVAAYAGRARWEQVDRG